MVVSFSEERERISPEPSTQKFYMSHHAHPLLHFRIPPPPPLYARPYKSPPPPPSSNHRQFHARLPTIYLYLYLLLLFPLHPYSIPLPHHSSPFCFDQVLIKLGRQA
ncbi:hypothetical protein SUGI_0122630 [Cryptomeria japonica]|nr:hypothetical protein SUGI_0122630 [Cryptomeria japonica]